MSTKQKIRQRMLARRQDLSKAAQDQAAQLALGQIKKVLTGKERVMLYMPFRGELDTGPVMKWLLEQGGDVALPLTDKENRLITPAVVTDLNACQPAAYGILEPSPSRCEQVMPSSLQAVVLPGVAFDLAGYRVGYGGGYYDRFLPRLDADCITIGYCYDWQLIDHFDADSWDQPLDYVVTDKRNWTVPKF